MVGVGRLALPRLFDLESNRSAVQPHAGFPRRSPKRRRVGDPGLALPRRRDSAILSRRHAPWRGAILLLNHNRESERAGSVLALPAHAIHFGLDSHHGFSL